MILAGIGQVASLVNLVMGRRLPSRTSARQGGVAGVVLS
jgi:hypothetical protein